MSRKSIVTVGALALFAGVARLAYRGSRVDASIGAMDPAQVAAVKKVIAGPHAMGWHV
jgi:hypothetical protein